jgi:hypothetical protein
MEPSEKKLGRNERCHCGSGKKYKHCHLNADQRSKSMLHRTPTDSESPRAPVEIEQLPDLLEKLSKKGPATDRAGFADLMAKAKPLITYLKREKEIEAAAAALEAHRTEFERLSKDEEAWLARTQDLFAEECFAPLRFTAADIKRAFDHVGYPATAFLNEEAGKTFRAAILHLADKERRASLAMELYSHLPDFVAAGRYLDGWLIQSCAHATGEFGDESNAFLFQMFSFGYDAWTAEKRALDDSLLGGFGLSPDRLHSMSADEIDAWLAAQTADPAKNAALEAFFRDNPALRSEAIANMESLEHDCIKLLDRSDARFLLLAPEEIEPWLPALDECCEKAQAILPENPDRSAPDATFSKPVQDAILSILREMAQSIFTRERIQQLISQLRKYRSEHFVAGDKTIAGYAMAAISSLEQENEPGQNRFLVALCLASFKPALEDAEDAENGGGSPP